MFHAAADLLGDHAAALWAALEQARSEGLAGKIGVSVYTPEEALAIADRFPIGIVQAPFSAFDQRMRSSGALRRLAEGGCEVHARSVFLQGFALADPARLPPHLAAHRARLEAFRSAAEAAGTTPLGLALAVARREARLARIVVGVQSRADLDEILAAWGMPDPDIDPARFASDDPALINPASWASAA
jgi:aryl-alcohol dehydrogenase-like predicted oxidoreductase